MISRKPQRTGLTESRPEGGFSLIEVMVALTILGLVLGALSQVLSGGLGNIGAAERYIRAAAIADSKLAGVGYEIPLEPGGGAGGKDGEFTWTISITPHAAAADAEPTAQGAAQLYEVAVSVRWPHTLGERRVTIDTLMNGVMP